MRWNRLMQVFTGEKVPVNGFASERCTFQNLHQNQKGDLMGLFASSKFSKAMSLMIAMSSPKVVSILFRL
jgi:hypothetical protein